MSVTSYAAILIVAELVYVVCSLVLDRLKKKRIALAKSEDKR